MTSLLVNNLSVTLSSREVLRDVSVALKEGEFVGLIGPNGAGKSTLIKALLELVPATGTITFDGRNLKALPTAERARIFSYLPQDREVAWPLTVEKVVALGRTPYLVPMRDLTSADREKVELAMAEADVLSFRSRIFSDLSGGERARVLIARALAQDTTILLADEPTAGLDPAHQIDLMRVLSGLSARGRIVLASLHELSLAARWCHRLILLHDGVIAADGMPKEVLTKDILRTAYGVSVYIATYDDGLIVQPLDRLAN